MFSKQSLTAFKRLQHLSVKKRTLCYMMLGFGRILWHDLNIKMKVGCIVCVGWIKLVQDSVE